MYCTNVILRLRTCVLVESLTKVAALIKVWTRVLMLERGCCRRSGKHRSRECGWRVGRVSTARRGDGHSVGTLSGPVARLEHNVLAKPNNYTSTKNIGFYNGNTLRTCRKCYYNVAGVLLRGQRNYSPTLTSATRSLCWTSTRSWTDPCSVGSRL